jgi:hypothetical protein
MHAPRSSHHYLNAGGRQYVLDDEGQPVYGGNVGVELGEGAGCHFVTMAPAHFSSYISRLSLLFRKGRRKAWYVVGAGRHADAGAGEGIADRLVAAA